MGQVLARRALEAQVSTTAVYEQERLLLHVQEAISLAVASSGMTKSQIAAAAGYSMSTSICNALKADGLTLHRISRLLHGAGYRLTVGLEKLP